MATAAEAYNIALEHYFADRKAEAADILARIINVIPDHPQALLLAGVLAGENGDMIQAARFFAKACWLRPADEGVANNLVKALQAAGKAGGGAENIQTFGEFLLCGRAEIIAAAAAAARRAGDLARAFALSRRAARLAPTNDAFRMLAQDAAAGGDNETAQTAQRDLLAISPWLENEWIVLASAAERQNDFQTAQRLYDRAFRLAPHRVDACIGLGRARRGAGLDREYYSHQGQDALVHRLFFANKPKKSGFFVDLGAFDGITWSNSLFFEQRLGWDGLCVEASPSQHRLYCANGRRAPCLNVAVGDHDGEAQFLEVTAGLTMMNGLVETLNPGHRAVIDAEGCPVETIAVPVRRLDGLLRERGIRHVDFLTADIEGGERAVVESLDPAEFTVDVLCLENIDADLGLRGVLDVRGFMFVGRFPGGDEIFVRRGFLQSR